MIFSAVSLGAPAPFATRASAARPPRRSATCTSRDASRRHAAPARSVRARVINNDAPAGAFSSADDADGLDIVGEDEFEERPRRPPPRRLTRARRALARARVGPRAAARASGHLGGASSSPKKASSSSGPRSEPRTLPRLFDAPP